MCTSKELDAIQGHEADFSFAAVIFVAKVNTPKSKIEKEFNDQAMAQTAAGIQQMVQLIGVEQIAELFGLAGVFQGSTASMLTFCASVKNTDNIK